MRDGCRVGNEAELIWRVGAEHTIHLGGTTGPSVGTNGVVVFSTPNMILLMERAARRVLEPYLEPGEESVGVIVNVEHLASAPIGSIVRGVAKVTSVDGRMVDFQIEAYDDYEMIGKGSHRRAVVRVDRLEKRIKEKVLKSPEQKVLPMQVDANTGTLPRLTTIDVEVRGAVVQVQLNRPSKRNAVNMEMTGDLERLTAWLAGHPELRIVVLQGKGEAFCAGDDVPEVGTLDLGTAQSLSHRQARLYLAWETLPQIFIAVVQGPAMGAGCVMACACDFRIASHNASFGMPEILLGWPPGYGIAQLTALIGKGKALEMCILGSPMTAKAAQEIGLIHSLVPEMALETEAKKWSDRLLALPSKALSETKRLIHLDEGMQPKISYLSDTAAYVRCLEHPDAQEGIAAFKDKRPPKYS